MLNASQFLSELYRSLIIAVNHPSAMPRSTTSRLRFIGFNSSGADRIGGFARGRDVPRRSTIGGGYLAFRPTPSSFIVWLAFRRRPAKSSSTPAEPRNNVRAFMFCRMPSFTIPRRCRGSPSISCTISPQAALIENCALLRSPPHRARCLIPRWFT